MRMPKPYKIDSERSAEADYIVLKKIRGRKWSVEAVEGLVLQAKSEACARSRGGLNGRERKITSEGEGVEGGRCESARSETKDRRRPEESGSMITGVLKKSIVTWLGSPVEVLTTVSILQACRTLLSVTRLSRLWIYRIPESLSAFCKMVSFTAAKTILILLVSVACVKCG